MSRALQSSKGLRLVAPSLPQSDIPDCGRQRLGLVLLAVGRDLGGVLLEALVVQDAAVGGRIVITAHPKADEIPILRLVSKPAPAGDLIHINADLSHAQLRSGHDQCRGY